MITEWIRRDLVLRTEMNFQTQAINCLNVYSVYAFLF